MKFLFVGNRKFVLEEMLALGLNISKILVIKDSYLCKDIIEMQLDFEIISAKKQLLQIINETNFDILISNGCPYILPVNKIPNKLLINIHPSFLPDLRGIDPVIGSILFRRDSGATCHIMNDKIDGGDIISQVKIPYSNDLDVSLLYQLSFLAEKEVFRKAYKRQFISVKKQLENINSIYYSRAPKDKLINFYESNETIINKIKAFNNISQGAYFIYRNNIYKVYDVEIVNNVFLNNHAKKYNNLDIIFNYEDCIVIKKDDEIIKLKRIVGPVHKLKNISNFNSIY